MNKNHPMKKLVDHAIDIKVLIKDYQEGRKNYYIFHLIVAVLGAF